MSNPSIPYGFTIITPTLGSNTITIPTPGGGTATVTPIPSTVATLATPSLPSPVSTVSTITINTSSPIGASRPTNVAAGIPAPSAAAVSTFIGTGAMTGPGAAAGMALAAYINPSLVTPLDEQKEELEKEKVRFNEQAFLMLNLEDLVAFSKLEADRFTEFAQIDVEADQTTAEFNNILFKNKVKLDLLLEATSLQMSTFVPKLRLFKELDHNGKSYSLEFPIAEGYSGNDFENIFKNKAGRGGGVGLKSFNWTSIGNSAGNQHTVEATVELLFESIEEITKIRFTNEQLPVLDSLGNIIPSKLSFADLLVQQVKYNASREYNPSYYRIKALLGWQVPNNWADDKKRPPHISKEFYNEMKNLTMELYMSLHSHEIDIADDSTVTLKIKYIAYVESLSHFPKTSNVFYSDADETFIQSLNTKKEEIKKIEQNYESSPNSTLEKQIKDLQKQIDELEYQDRERIYTRILQYIYDNNKLRYFITTQQNFENFISLAGKKDFTDIGSIGYYNKRISEIIQQNSKLNSSSPTSGPSTAPTVPVGSAATTIEGLKTNIEKYSISQYEDILKQALQGSTEEEIKLKQYNKVVPYFFLGDLLDSILSGLYGARGFLNKEVKVVLGPLTIYDYGRLEDAGSVEKQKLIVGEDEDGKQKVKIYTGKQTNINVADIPISLSTYNSWFLTEIVDKNISVMSFRDFLNSLLNNLVIRSMGSETYAFAPRQKTRLVFKTKTLPKREGRFSEIGSLRYTTNHFKDKPFTSSGDDPYGPKKIENFIFVYSISNNPWKLKSNYESDLEKGIRHLQYGSETGLVKNIKFKRQDNKHIRTHNIRIASSINSDKSILLREIYNADVQMLGNNFFEIGEIIYVTPSLFGSSSTEFSRVRFAKDLGIGGYFMILKINNNISPGNYETSLTLQWVAKGDGIPNNILDGTAIKKDVLIL